jgi:hypothetical protein
MLMCDSRLHRCSHPRACGKHLRLRAASPTTLRRRCGPSALCAAPQLPCRKHIDTVPWLCTIASLRPSKLCAYVLVSLPVHGADLREALARPPRLAASSRWTACMHANILQPAAVTARVRMQPMADIQSHCQLLQRRTLV